MEQMRSEFERWWELKYHNGNPPRFGWEHWRDDDGYHDIEFNGMWDAWQASRQAVEIKMMPDINPLMFNEDVLFGYHKAKTEDENSIRAAGLRIKGE